MGSGYEIEPRPLGRSARHMPTLVAAVVVSLIVVIAKPWQGPPATPPPAAEGAVAAGTTIVAAASSLDPTASATAIETPAWPSDTGGSSVAGLPTWADAVLAPLVRHAGTWGVGNGGAGARYTRDAPWLAWAPARPMMSGSSPGTILRWPGTDLCAGLPALDARPAFIAVTTPRSLAADWYVTGWWSDGNRVASLGEAVWLISSPGERGIKFLERLDGTIWPAGRYEFHVVDGDDTVALTICLAQPG